MQGNWHFALLLLDTHRNLFKQKNNQRGISDKRLSLGPQALLAIENAKKVVLRIYNIFFGLLICIKDKANKHTKKVLIHKQ